MLKKIGTVLVSVFLLASSLQTYSVLSGDARFTAYAENASASNYRIVYVSKDGRIGASGTINDPFPTIDMARDALKGKTSASAPGIVYIREGTYKLTDSISLSGGENSYVTYAAYPNEKVEITGSSELSLANFKKLSEVDPKDPKYSSQVRLQPDVKNKIYVYDLGAENIPVGSINKNGFNWKKLPFQPELVVNDIIQTLAKYPNGDSKITLANMTCAPDERGDVARNYFFDKTDNTLTYDQMMKLKGPVFTVNNLKGTDGRWLTWAPPTQEGESAANLPDKNPLNDNTKYETDGCFSGYFGNNYANDMVKIYSVSSEKIICKFPTIYGVDTTVNKNYLQVVAYNVLCELDTPGEYYIDRWNNNNILYYYPEGGTLDGKSITLTSLDKPLFTLDGVTGVKIKGIKLSGTTSYGITMNNCESCTVERCELLNISMDAVRIGQNNGTITSDPSYTTWGGGHNNKVVNCLIHDIGCGGVYLSGGNRKTLERGNNIVEHCEFYNLSNLQTYMPAVYLEGVGNTAQYNYIHDCPHMVIQIMGNDMLIMHNKIINTVTNASDQAPIYCGRDWTNLGNEISYNYIDSVGKSNNYGIYMDDHMSGMIIRNNIIKNVNGSGIYMNQGFGHYITDNIIIDVTGSYFKASATSKTKRPIDNEKVLAYRWFDFLRSGDGSDGSYTNTPENIKKWIEHYNELYNSLPDYSKKEKYKFALENKYLPLGYISNSQDYKDDPMWTDLNSILVQSNITFMRNIVVGTKKNADISSIAKFNDPDTFDVNNYTVAKTTIELGLDETTGKFNLNTPLNTANGFETEWVKNWNDNFDISTSGIQPQTNDTEIPDDDEQTNVPTEISVTAIPTTSSVLLDGKKISFDAYNINGYNYFKLRDLAMALNGTAKQFDVTWDAVKNAISLIPGKAYTPAGGELSVSTNRKIKEAIITRSKIYLDGKEVRISAYNIDGNNYFKLRDIAEILGFNVSWDKLSNTINIDTRN